MKQKFFLGFLSCLICISLFSISAFADDITVVDTSVDWFSPPEDSYYVYHTRRGSYWYYDLPASPAAAPISFLINKHGSTSDVQYVTVPAGAEFYVELVGSDYTLFITSNGSTSSSVLRGYSSSISNTYYCLSPTVTNLQGSNLIGSPYVHGGSFISSGFTYAIGFTGQVLNFIVDSPVLICVGISVGVFLCGFGISKVKDLIKGY